MKAKRLRRYLYFGMLAQGLALANPGVAGESYCFNAGVENAWDCNVAADSSRSLGREYHTLKVVLPKGGDNGLLDQVLPIERIAEIPLPSGETVLFLGRFRDSMKAFRVVQKCRDVHSTACSRYAPKVVRIGFGEQPERAGKGEVQLASLDLKTKTAGDLVQTKLASLDISDEAVGEAVSGSLGSLNPKGLIKLPDSLQHVFWVDLKEGNLHVLQRTDDRFKVADTMSISIGKQGFGKMVQGDKKTPVGVYRLLGHLTDEQLDDFYGVGAYTLNYPNVMDRIKKRTGSGIWLHGLPKGKDHRPLQDSDGCVVLSNNMIAQIGKYVDLQQSTPIVLDDAFEWVDSGAVASGRRELEQAIESWRTAWSALDNDAYLSFYADDFTSLEKDLEAWKAYKTRIHKAKKYIRVTLSDLSLLAYPGEENAVLARFYQRYRSSNFNASGWKEQLWRKGESGQWRIVFEQG